MSAGNQTNGVVLCADDFGMNEAVDFGIIRLAEQGRLAAASCLAHGPTFEANAARLALSGAQTGLHLNFTEPMGREGVYLPLSTLIRRAYLRQLDVQAVKAQIHAQIDAFHAVMGKAPAFVDGHQHIHQLPQIREALIQTLARRYLKGARPWLRNTKATALKGIPGKYRLKAAIIQILGANAFGRLARREGFRLNARFAGVYDFRGGESAYRALFAAWLKNTREGDLIMCHPAAWADSGDPMGAQRLAEFNVLLEQKVGGLLPATEP